MNWHDPQQACAEYRRLDAKFHTDARSPLHHDQRCPVHSPFLAERLVVVTVDSSEGRL